MVTLSKWSTVAAGNDQAAGPPSWPKENMDKSDVNDSMREMMASIRVWYDDPAWVAPFEREDLTVTVTRLSGTELRLALSGVDLSGYFGTRQRIRIDGDGGKVSGFIDSVTHLNPNTDVTITIDASGTVPTNPTKVELGATNLDRGAYFDVGTAAGQMPLGSDLAASFVVNLGATSAANKLYGTEPDELPQNSDLGSASLKTTGTAGSELPTNDDLPTFGALASLDKGKRKYTFLSSDFALPNGALNEITGLDGVTFPGTPDGSKKYRVAIRLFMDENISGDIELLNVHMGTGGTKTDPIMSPIPFESNHVSSQDLWGSNAAAGDSGFAALDMILTPGASDKLTIVCQTDTSSDIEVLAANTGNTTAQGNNQASYIYMELLDDLWED